MDIKTKITCPDDKTEVTPINFGRGVVAVCPVCKRILENVSVEIYEKREGERVRGS